MSKKEENFKRFKRTPLAMNFVKKNNGEWNHKDWNNFCKKLEEKGYTPINFDEVGLLLEEKKKKNLSKK